ncbi:MAG: hypothetical protein ACOYLF_06845 [Blastocatellia bacterium]
MSIIFTNSGWVSGAKGMAAAGGSLRASWSLSSVVSANATADRATRGNNTGKVLKPGSTASG